MRIVSFLFRVVSGIVPGTFFFSLPDFVNCVVYLTQRSILQLLAENLRAMFLYKYIH